MTSPLFGQVRTAINAEYVVERELGGGGMSHVFLAEERRFGRRVVVKVLRPDLAASVSADRFEREIRLAAQLQDPRIVPLLTAGSVDGLAFYTMPFVDGESLRARLGRGRVPIDEAIDILRDVALALDYAHRRQVVHRDIKPENILLTGRTAVVTDFGIAKAITAATAGSVRGTMTLVGTVIGTPAYMAPEQASGEEVDTRTDLYAWGVVAYEMLSGVHPFAAHATAQSLIAAHIAEEPAPLSQRAPEVPAPLASLVSATLAKERDERPASAGELVRVLDGLTSKPARDGAPRRARWLTGAAALGGALVLVAAGTWALIGRHDESQRRADRGTNAPRSIAVLPFVSTDRDSANEYFGVGMAEELTTAFARVPGLRVASRGSPSRFRDAGAPIGEIARQLGVATILEGSVRRAGDRIRVTARLVDPRDGTILWSDEYDRRRAEVFDVQDEMANAIVTALRPRFSDSSSYPAARALRGTDDLAAYDLYLKGRYYFGRRGELGLPTAITYFEQAIARDPRFARAWAGLSMAQVTLPFFSNLPADSLLKLAARSAERALQLDSTLSDAYLARAYALKGEWRWKEAEPQFQNALALAPDDAAVRHWYGVYLYVLGRTDEALTQLRRGRELDPLSSAVGTDLHYLLYMMRRDDEAIAEARRVMTIDSTRSDLTLQIGMADLARGHPDSAVTQFEKAARLGTGFDTRAFLSVAHRRLGRTRQADSLYTALLDSYRTDHSLGYAVAIAATSAGDFDRAIGAVKQTIESRSLFATELGFACDPIYDPLKKDPRFTRLLTGAGMKVCAS